MIDIQRLYEFGVEVRERNINIVESHVVIDESEVVQILKEFKGGNNNHILVIVAPSYDSSSSLDIDSIDFTNYLQFLILEKKSLKELKSNLDFVMLYQRTQSTINYFLDYLLSGILDDEEVCSIFRELNTKSIQIDPMKGPSDCFGYTISLMVN